MGAPNRPFADLDPNDFQSLKRYLLYPVKELAISVRAANALVNMGLDVIAHVYALSQLHGGMLEKGIPNFGIKLRRELEEALSDKVPLATLKFENPEYLIQPQSEPWGWSHFTVKDVKALEEYLAPGVVTYSDPEKVTLVFPDEGRHWLYGLLPEELREGLRPTFLQSLVNDPEVQAKVRELLVAETIRQLVSDPIKTRSAPSDPALK